MNKILVLLLIMTGLGFGQTKNGYGSGGYGTSQKQLKAKINFKRVATTTVPSVTLSCTAGAVNNGAGAPVGFNFLRSTSSGGPYTLLGTSPMTSTCGPYTDQTVALGTTYYYVADAMNAAGTSGFSNQVTAQIPNAPTITGISPNSGAAAGGTAVTITGAGFAPGATVTFDGITATNVVVVSSTAITAVTPADSNNSATVAVTNTNGLSGSLTNAFTYIQLPAAPTGLTVQSTTASSVPLKWTAPKPQPEYTTVAYEVDRGPAPTLPSPTLIGITPGTSFTDKTPCKLTCYYEVKAYDINQVGPAFIISAPRNIVKVTE
jgi:hypothetical protein